MVLQPVRPFSFSSSSILPIDALPLPLPAIAKRRAGPSTSVSAARTSDPTATKAFRCDARLSVRG
jgi:hypothetical protein